MTPAVSQHGAPWVDPRPGTVTAAGVLTVLLGMFGILATLATGGLLVALGFFIDALAGSKGGTPEDRVSPLAITVGVVVVAVGVLLGVLHILLGARVMRGGAVSRVLLTVWDGVAVLAAGSATVGLVGGALSGDVSLSLAVLPALALAMPVAVLVCLWSPASSAWFARAAQRGSGR